MRIVSFSKTIPTLAPALLALAVAGCAGGAGSIATPGGSQPQGTARHAARTHPPSISHFDGFESLYAFTVSLDSGNVIHPYAGVYQDSASSLYVPLNGQESVNYGAIVKLTKSGKNFNPTVIHAFSGGSDGAHPKGALVADGDTLYGTTARGGSSSLCSGTGCGTVFSLTPAENGYNGYDYAIDCVFKGSPSDDPAELHAGLVEYKGTFYGTSNAGGSANDGTVFSFSPKTKKCKVLYSFQNGPNDGGNLNGALIVVGGTLYGTASTGGGTGCGGSGCGTVFSMPLSGGAPTVLHAFSGVAPDGANPEAALVADSEGALYGTTAAGGKYGNGMVFQIASGKFNDLYDFEGYAMGDGQTPWSTLTLKKGGYLYGTTQAGGSGTCTQESAIVGCGTVFQLNPGTPYTEDILYSFTGAANPPDGDVPYAGVLIGKGGLMYGTTYTGGSTDANLCPIGCGLIFEARPVR
jgi:uncharacterized repeat protein (TIGR03803 family)